MYKINVLVSCFLECCGVSPLTFNKFLFWKGLKKNKLNRQNEGLLFQERIERNCCVTEKSLFYFVNYLIGNNSNCNNSLIFYILVPRWITGHGNCWWCYVSSGWPSGCRSSIAEKVTLSLCKCFFQVSLFL